MKPRGGRHGQVPSVLLQLDVIHAFQQVLEAPGLRPLVEAFHLDQSTTNEGFMVVTSPEFLEALELQVQTLRRGAKASKAPRYLLDTFATVYRDWIARQAGQLLDE